ncbi:nitroreductase family deazaflavin-dependent oxidoreductase [Nakamurella flavida]|uniref:Nitroreductase family deazaflavin-dependent oxidoreductase n=1 Tax=Nakamurella flavida TaxID=363630 RepID=A0A939C2W2_9ACTN|nr:nitroreductase family deazaflavin-dependent oxidoreductase [Nakamurella flavida]MBM9476446.1 nitroreductase family deazaflavin-dependent oxidoreductase [Nakamurella flavida]MDP9779453.1 deazaflavin-dependent oxidoreductase (nitroreductase family) [Nakamurella flavida]
MSDFNTRIIEDFHAHDGHVGPPFEGAPMVLVHHRGAKSGAERVTPLVWFDDGGRMVIVASAAGAPSHPAWYHNLLAHPEITVDIGHPERSATTLDVRAEEITGTERDEIYARIVAIMPGFGEYETKTAGIRTIPLFALTPRSSD